MEYQNGLFNKNVSILYIFLLLIFFNCFYISINVIYTGEYPYIKRLLNGNYIVLSDTNITFTDGTLETQLNFYNFDNHIYGDDNKETKVGSTIVSQFKFEDNEYIIAILNQQLFIFSSNGIYQNNINVSFINAKFLVLLYLIAMQGIIIISP